MKRIKRTKIEEKNKLFFISDLHFNHHGIIEMCNRPFKDVHEMNTTLIDNWNNTIEESDTVYIGGDFSHGNTKTAKEILSVLNGKKYLIIGNHDHNNILRASQIETFFEDIQYYYELDVKDETMSNNIQMIVLMHYPIMSFNGQAKGSWQLFGHIHHNNWEAKTSPNQFNMCVENINYTPISYNNLKIIINHNQNILNYKKS